MKNLAAAKVDDLQQPDDRRLIDEGLRSLEVSSSGVAERYARGRTAHSGQVWWARRPHAAMRALVFSLMCRDQSAEASDLLVALANEIDDVETLYRRARELIKAGNDKPPVVLDPFGGGGTIPHEAASLGASALSFDYNPMASFVQAVNLEWSQEAYSKSGKTEVLSLLGKVGNAVICRAEAATAPLYPARSPEAGNPPFVYLWSYKYRCKICDYGYFVSRRPWISRKAGRAMSIGFKTKGDDQETMLISGDELSFSRSRTGRKVSFNCPRCDTSAVAHIKECADVILAVGRSAKGRSGKTYEAASEQVGLAPPRGLIEQFIAKALCDIGEPLPQTDLPRWSGIVNPSIYGITGHKDIFNPRQLAVCLALMREIKASYDEVRASYGNEVARYISAALSGLVDQLVDWNSRLSMWIPQNEQVGRGFCGPGISMLWDYAEVDAFGHGPSNLREKLKRIVKAADFIPEFTNPVWVKNSPAQALPLDDASIDLVITDPPYYDNIFYDVLADNFYVWKRMIYRHLCPQFFEREITGSALELVASKNRQGSSALAHDWYVEQLSAATKEMARILKPDGRVAFVYGHSSLLGWEAIVRAFRASGLAVEAMEPLAIERRQRPRAMSSDAVNTCIVIIAHHAVVPFRVLQIGELRSAHASRSVPVIMDLEMAGWSAQDAGMASFAIGVGMVSASAGVQGYSDLEALREIVLWVKSQVKGFKMAERGAI